MRALSKYILISISLLNFYSCELISPKETPQNTFPENQHLVNTTGLLNDRLEFAFKQYSIDSLRQIFSEWNEKIKPNTEEFINQNDTIEAVFNIYKEIYQPSDLLKLGDWEWGNNLNSNSSYFVIQNKIFFAVTAIEDFDNLNLESIKWDSISNFKPLLNLDGKKILYLTAEYEKALNKFLGLKSTEMGELNFMTPSLPAGESEKRYELIRPFIPILHGHWGEYWHLETHPYIGIILLDPTLSKAYILFRVGYQGGEATLKKQNKKWTIEKSEATWIE